MSCCHPHLFERQTRVHIKIEDAVWVEVAVRQWVQRRHVSVCHFFAPGVLTEHLLDHKGVHVDHRRLQQMQAEDRDFMIVTTIGHQLIAIAVEDEVVHPVPALYDIESGMDLAAQLRVAEIPAQKDRFNRLAQFQQRREHRVRLAPCKAA